MYCKFKDTNSETSALGKLSHTVLNQAKVGSLLKVNTQ